MSALAELSVPEDGAEFLDLDALVRALDDWAVKNKFCFRTTKRDAAGALFVCAEADEYSCPWKCRTRPVGSEDFHILRILNGQHTCVGRRIRPFSSATKKDWLDAVVTRHLHVTGKTTPQDIVDLLRVRFAEQISYKVAQLCRLRLLEGDIGAHRHSFTLLPAYRDHLETVAPGVFVDLVRDIHSRFQRIFICPPVSRETFCLCRRIVVADGTFLKGRFILMLLLAVGIDPNGEQVLLAWGVVESENADSWTWFLRNLCHVLPDMATEECTFVSDRDKGLLSAEAVLGPQMVTAWCYHHLKTNFTEKFGRALGPLFWRIARAHTRAIYDAALHELREQKADAAAYLEAQEPKKWAECMFLGRRYGQDTSNLVESLNHVLRFDRDLPITELLDAIWHRVMEKRSVRLEAATSLEEGCLSTPWVDKQLEIARQWAGSNSVQVSSLFEGRVA